MIDFPASPTLGQTFTAAGVTWTYDGAKWTLGPSAPNLITVSDTPPPNPSQGALWWESVNGQMYVFYNDGSSSQWVPTTNQIGGGYMLSKGVADGSDAAPGFVGEVISSVNTAGVSMTTVTNANIATISLTPGDWDVFGEAWFNFSAAGVTIAGALNVNSSALPSGGPAMNTSRVQLIAPISAGLQSLTLACRASLATATAYYLIGQVAFASGTVNATGKIWARRAR